MRVARVDLSCAVLLDICAGHGLGSVTNSLSEHKVVHKCIPQC